MTEKKYISSQDLLDDSFALAAKVFESGFRPDWVVALWRGGTPIALAVQEYLDTYWDYNSNSIAIRTSSYHGIEQRQNTVDIYGISHLRKCLNHSDNVLIVDDIFDTGQTLKAVTTQLAAQEKNNIPLNIRTAVPWYKPLANTTDIEPDYYLHTTDKWICFPYELEGLTYDEIRNHLPNIHNIIKSAL